MNLPFRPTVVTILRNLFIPLLALLCLSAHRPEHKHRSAEVAYGGYVPLPSGVFNVNIIGQMYKNGQCQGAVCNKINTVKGLDTALYWSGEQTRAALLAQIKVTVSRTLGLGLTDTSGLHLGGITTFYCSAPEQIADLQKNNAYVLEAISVSHIRIPAHLASGVLTALERNGMDTLEDVSCKRDENGVALKFQERILFAAVKVMTILSDEKQVYKAANGSDTLVVDNPDNTLTVPGKKEGFFFRFAALPDNTQELASSRERHQACLTLYFERANAEQYLLTGQAIVCPELQEMKGTNPAALVNYQPAAQYRAGRRRTICSTLDGNTITTYVFTLVSQQVEYAAQSALTKPGSFKPKRVTAKLLFETHYYTCKMPAL